MTVTLMIIHLAGTLLTLVMLLTIHTTVALLNIHFFYSYPSDYPYDSHPVIIMTVTLVNVHMPVTPTRVRIRMGSGG
jgi:flagellar biosynthesis component FlhA